MVNVLPKDGMSRPLPGIFERIPDDLLKTIKKNTDSSNKIRIKNGSSPLEVLGWVEIPNYKSAMHRLTFSILANEGSKDKTVNYRQILLGREGYFIFNQVSLQSHITDNKVFANEVTSSLHYDAGKRYEDFVNGRDRVAGYGLAALITGVAAKKLGLIAILSAFIIKIWKLAFLIPILLWGWIKKLFGQTESANSEER